jgi:hypothetical protein
MDYCECSLLPISSLLSTIIATKDRLDERIDEKCHAERNTYSNSRTWTPMISGKIDKC